MQKLLDFITDYWVIIAAIVGSAWGVAKWVTSQFAMKVKENMELQRQSSEKDTEIRVMKRNQELAEIRQEIIKNKSDLERDKLEVMQGISKINDKYLSLLEKYEKRWERHSIEHDKLAEKWEFMQKELFTRMGNVEKSVISIEGMIKMMSIPFIAHETEAGHNIQRG